MHLNYFSKMIMYYFKHSNILMKKKNHRVWLEKEVSTEIN